MGVRRVGHTYGSVLQTHYFITFFPLLWKSYRSINVAPDVFPIPFKDMHWGIDSVVLLGEELLLLPSGAPFTQ